MSTAVGSPAAPSPAPVSAATQAARLEREKRRLALRTRNQSIWSGHHEAAPSSSSSSSTLDSSLKRNTAFIKRVRQGLGADAKEALAKDIASLNLAKYIEEVIQAVPEGLAKCVALKDISAAGETVSTLHERFPPSTFAIPLTHLLTAQLAPPVRATLQAIPAEQREKDEAARVARQRSLLRAAAELALVEVLRNEAPSGAKAKAAATEAQPKDETSPGQEWLYGVLRELLATDRDHANVAILVALLKAFGSALLGPASDAATDQPTPSSLLHPSTQSRFRKLCESYFATLARRVVKEHSKLREQDKRNHEAYIRSGEIFEDRANSYERMTRAFEKVLEGAKSLAELISLPMPELTDDSRSNGLGLAISLDAKGGASAAEARLEEEFASGKSPWEDEDTRRFYEELVDLKDLVPIGLLGGPAKGGAAAGWAKEASEGAPAKDEAQPTTSESTPADSTPTLKSNPSSATSSPVLEQAELADAASAPADAAADSLASGPAAQLGVILARLPEMTNRALIDSAAVEFALINSKAARRRLVKHLAGVSRQRLDLIPYYARLTATLDSYMPDVGQGVIAILLDEFRYLQRKRGADLAETRSKNMRFLGELTKFKVTPMHSVFYCFKVCLDDFSGANVDNVATLLETCGRFLLRTRETSERTRSLLEMLRRKRAAQNLDQRQLLLLDNAYYHCNPSERRAVEPKQRPPLQLYVRHLIYDVLAKRTVDRVVKQLRKLPWDDPEAVQWLRECFVRPWRIRYSYIHLLAVLIHDLQPYHADFTTSVIDDVCEQLRAGMELNVYSHSMRRVAVVRMLGELYNYRLVNSGLIFDQLWSLVTFGHANGQPLPTQFCPIDAPDDYFRLRLICTLLDTCGHCFDRGTLRKRLDEFLAFLNVYVLSKEQPVPMDVDFMLQETLETLRPKLVFKRTFDEAAEAVNVMSAAYRTEAPQDEEEDESESEEEDVESGDEGAAKERRAARNRAESGGESSDGEESGSETAGEDGSSGEDDEEEDSSAAESEEEEEETVSRLEDPLEKEAEDDFERELAKMMADMGGSGGAGGGPGGASSGRAPQKGFLDAGIPFIRRTKQQQPSQQESRTDDAKVQDEGTHMRFSLLSRKGNKQMTTDVQVPIDAAIAVSTRTKQLQDEAERQQLKRMVLSSQTLSAEEERRELEKTMARRGIKLRYADGG